MIKLKDVSNLINYRSIYKNYQKCFFFCWWVVKILLILILLYGANERNNLIISCFVEFRKKTQKHVDFYFPMHILSAFLFICYVIYPDDVIDFFNRNVAYIPYLKGTESYLHHTVYGISCIQSVSLILR